MDITMESRTTMDELDNLDSMMCDTDFPVGLEKELFSLISSGPDPMDVLSSLDQADLMDTTNATDPESPSVYKASEAPETTVGSEESQATRSDSQISDTSRDTDGEEDSQQQQQQQEGRAGSRRSLRTSRRREYDLRHSSVQNRIETETKRKKPRQPKPKTKPPPLSKYRRKTANARERGRMQEINEAFEILQKAVPDFPEDASGKLTKITTLRLAMNYIVSLRTTLGYNDDYTEEGAIRGDPVAPKGSGSGTGSGSGARSAPSSSSSPSGMISSPPQCPSVSSDSCASPGSGTSEGADFSLAFPRGLCGAGSLQAGDRHSSCYSALSSTSGSGLDSEGEFMGCS